MKKLLKIFLATSTLLLITGCGCANKNVTTEENNTDQQAVAFADQTVDKLIIKDMNIVYEDEISHVSFDISNENTDTLTYTELTINFYDIDGILIYSTYESVGTLDGGESMSVSLNSDVDLTQTSIIEYEIQ